MPDLSKEQVADIQEREKKGLEYLKELKLTPAAIIQKIRVGDDMFVDKVTPFLQDTKYVKPEPVKSPIQDVEKA